MPIGITVVIPSFNQGEFITDTLRSITDQKYPAVQIIVQDGGSTDATLEILRSFAEKIEWTSEPDKGQSDAIERGFAKAKYDWIAWLNSDDIHCNDALWKVDAAVSGNPHADVVIGNGHYMDRQGKFLRPYPRIDLSPGRDVKQAVFEGGYLAQPSTYFRHEKYRAIGGINKALHLGMDYELWCRFALAGLRFVPVEDDISGNRWHDESKSSSQQLSQLAEVCATQKRLFGKVSFYYAQTLSDALFQTIRVNFLGPEHSLFYRTLFFKSVWTWLNVHDQDWWRQGLFDHNISRSGAIRGDEIDNAAWIAEAKLVVDLKMLRKTLKALYRRLPRSWW